MKNTECVAGVGLAAIIVLIGMGNDVAEGSVSFGPCDNANAGGTWEKCTYQCSSSGYICSETVEHEYCSCADSGTFYSQTINFVDGVITTGVGGTGPNPLDACGSLTNSGYRCINCTSAAGAGSGSAAAVKWQTTSCNGITCVGHPSTNWDCCSTAEPCGFGEGDCDFDTDCDAGLYCGSDNCLLYHSHCNSSSWSSSADCCTDDSEHEIPAVELSDTGDAVVTNIGQDMFNVMFHANPIVFYYRNGMLHSIYKRVSEVPLGFDAYTIFTYTWSSTNNQLNIDFEIYSNLEDLEARENNWSYCSFNEYDVGYPRDCGPSGAQFNEWWSMPGGNYTAPGLFDGASFYLFGALPPESTWNDGSNEWATMIPSPTPPNAIDGGWGHWSPYGPCSVDCGGGLRNRTRCCDNPWPMNGGLDCLPSGNIMHIEYEVCNTDTCAIHCQWNAWQWDTCTQTCGTGTQTANRTKIVVESNGGTCTGSDTSVETCNENDCPVDCNWNEWSVTSCNETCGGGWITKNRTEANPELHGGMPCNGSSLVEISCNEHDCPVDCEWGLWLSWTTCTVSCGGGIQTRQRFPNNPPAQFGGADCVGDDEECQDCNLGPCPSTCPP